MTRHAVELHPAYTWDCDNCGRENFCHTVVAHISPEEEAELRERFGIEPWEEGNFQSMPGSVTCSHCGVTFSTEHSA